MQNKQTAVSIFFIIILFSFYIVLSVFLTIVGGNIYQRNVVSSALNYNMRTSAFYLTEKARKSNDSDSISINTLGDNDALVLSQTLDNNEFETWIYIEDGYLCEAMIISGSNIAKGIGQKIMPLNGLELSLDENNLLQVGITDESGNKFQSTVFLSCLGGIEV